MPINIMKFVMIIGTLLVQYQTTYHRRGCDLSSGGGGLDQGKLIRPITERGGQLR